MQLRHAGTDPAAWWPCYVPGMTRAATKVLSIVGPGRSGTTILASILGEVDGIVSGGELRWLWRRGLIERRSCGCGLAPADCPVWAEVVGRVPGYPDVVPAIVRAQDEIASRLHRLTAIRSAAGGDSGWAALSQVRSVMAEVIPALADVTGARVVVDSSKRAQDAAVVAGLPDVEHYVLHMVRDPRAVAYSWRRADKTVRLADGPRAMATRRLLPSVVRWSENCLSAETLRRCVPARRWLFLRYEDFATDPGPAVDRILDFLGVDDASPFVGANTVRLSTNHTVAGNPNRFRTGEVRIAHDDEWITHMSRRDQLAVQALTLPFLLRYRYPLRHSPTRDRRDG